MNLVKPSIQSIWKTPNALKIIEWSGRTCYKSEDKLKPGSEEKFVRMIIKNGHHAMLEHASASYRVICDRGVTHEIVRHRLFSYAQESTRYCNYKGGVTYILPPWIRIPGKMLAWELDVFDDRLCFEDEGHGSSIPFAPEIISWFKLLQSAEATYIRLLSIGWTPQQARSVLPNALKTEIVITGNLREWRHFFKLRCSPKAHPQMQEIANMILKDIRERIPVVFDEDIL